MGRAGFEPAKAEPPDLQSGPFGRLGICPRNEIYAGESAPEVTLWRFPSARIPDGMSRAGTLGCETVELAVGIEPTTSRLQIRCSAVELR